MVGELYKTSLGWAVRYPYSKLDKRGEFNIVIIPIENEEIIKDSDLGRLVYFTVKIKNLKSSLGKMPYAKISLN